MPNSITNRQLVFILFLVLTAYGVIDIPRAMAASAGTGAWFTISVTAFLFSLAVVMIVSLNNMYPGKMFFDFSRELIGKFGSYALTIYFLLGFSLFIVFLVTQMATLLQTDFMAKTPKWATMLIGIPVFCFTAYKGITNVARVAEIIGLIFIITSVIVHILMFTQSKINNVLPLFDPADMGKYLGAVKDAVIPFVGAGVLFVIPMTKENGGKKAVRTAFFTLLGIGLLYVLVAETSIMKVGINDIVHYKDSLIVAIRDMEIPFLDFLKRMDILYLTVGFMGFFMGNTLIYTVIVEYLCKIFIKASRIAVVLCTGAVTYVLCLWADSVKGFEEFTKGLGVYLCISSAFIIPGILLIIAKVKKHGRKNH